jgi:hypothetical protein
MSSPPRPPRPTPDKTIQLSTDSTVVLVGATVTFTAVSTSGDAIAWSLEEGGGCGQVSSDGVYSAPEVVPDPPYCHVVARSVANPQHSATISILINQEMTTGTPGVWERVPTPGISLDPGFSGQDNYGVQNIVVDPLRPNELYLFTCYQGLWKSTDYGLTWNKHNTGEGKDLLDGGRAGGFVWPDPTRDASAPPTLYATALYGTLGVFKSTDGGVNWIRFVDDRIDGSAIDVDPYDNRHMIVGRHELDLGMDPYGVGESWDAGETWNWIATPIGSTLVPFFVDTGDAESTAKTFFLTPQIDHGSSVMTHDGGLTFTPIEHGGFARPHGSQQSFRDKPGVVYTGGSNGGVWRSEMVMEGGSPRIRWSVAFSSTDYPYESGVIGTPTTLYAWNNGATHGDNLPWVYTAPRATGTGWTLMQTPPAMNNGAVGMAVTYDGQHHILVGGNFNAGVWRYVEP